MDRITDSFAWPLKDPQWVSKLLIIGLLLIIPIIGWINALGWMLNTMDNLRAGRMEMAPGNLSHLSRGVNLFVVYIVYYLALLCVYGALVGLGSVLASIDNTAARVIGIFALLFGYAFYLVGSLALLLCLPAIVLLTERGGIGGGLHVVALARQVRATFTQSLLAGLMVLVASFISSLGIIACCVGVLFTSAYATAMWAWIFRSYELGSGPHPSPGQLATT